MKSFKNILSEVAQPKPEEEKRFKAQHNVEVAPHPVANETQHKGIVKPKAKRKADQEGDANYDKAYMESVEELDEISRDTARSYIRKAAADNADRKDKVMKPFPMKDMEKNVAMHKKMKSREKGIELAGKKAYGIGGKAKVNATESVDLEEDITKMSHGRLKFHMNTGTPHGSYTKDQMKAERDRRLKTGEGEAYKKAKMSMSEDLDQLDEIGDTSAGKKKLKNLIVNRTQKVVDAGASIERRPEKAAEYDRAQKRHMKTIGRAATRLAKEEVEQLDELSPDLKSRYAKKAATSLKRATTYKAKAQDDAAKASKNIDRGYGGDRSVNIDKQYNRLDRADAKVAKHDKTISKRTSGLKRANEEVEQLDELSPNTLHSYIKKAAGNMAGNAAVAAAQASSSMKKSSPDVKRNIKNRMRGITGASGRLADKANMAENWQEEVPMMMRQLEFISYAAEEIMDYLDMAGDPEEWFQNKLAGIHQSMLSMYAYAQGGRRAGYGFDEEVDLEEELKGGQKKLDHNKNGKLDAHDFKLMRAKKMKEEAEALDEVSQKTLWNYYAKAGADLQKKREKLNKGTLTMKDLKKGQNRVKGLNRAANKMDEEVEQVDEVTRSAVKRPVKVTGPDGITRTVYKSARSVNRDEHGQEKIKTNESVEMLEEAYKAGIVKLKDGSSVVLKKEDADLLNQMFKDLSAGNRKKMQEVAMKDKSGFEEILGFAREAL